MTAGAFVRRHDGTAYHYTDTYGVFGMITGHQVWATAYTMLNDELEIRHGVEEVVKAMKTWKPGPQTSPVAEAVLRDYVATLETVFETLPIYIISASKRPDLVNQYQGYAGGGGYAVGFKADAMLRPFDTEPDNSIWSSSGWLEVFYDATAKRGYAHEIFDQLAAGNSILTIIPGVAGPGWVLQDSLAALVSVLKHHSFSAEEEVRYAITYRGRPSFRPSQRGVVPFLKVGNHHGPLDAPEPDKSLDIESLYVGPPSATAARRIRTLDLLLEKDYPTVRAEDSEIPYVP